MKRGRLPFERAGLLDPEAPADRFSAVPDPQHAIHPSTRAGKGKISAKSGPWRIGSDEDQVPTLIGATNACRVAMTLRAVSLPVRGLSSLGTFWMDIWNDALSDSTSID